MPVMINGFEIDVATAEDHTLDSDITDHPVERGANVTDHVIRKPRSVKIDGIVSNTPIGPLEARRAGQGKPADNAYAMLLALDENEEPVTIVTTLQSWPNMLLEKLSIPKNVKVGDALQFSATFKQMTFVDNERTIVKVAIPSAAGRENVGAKATTNPVDAAGAIRDGTDAILEPLRRYPKGSPQRRVYDRTMKPSLGDAFKGQNPFNHDLK